jgi:transcriptional regulator with GAF, ATPase, and Fis domain
MLTKELKNTYGPHIIIGNSAHMQKIISIIGKIADTNSTVLVTGESGTGKELIAKTIHYHSSRAKKPFVPISCAAIPRDILESELFGHEKGAFTGATTTRLGRFELANNGTLFLDEIGELDPSLQVKLLRVLQEREFERIGSAKSIKVDVRIIAATNRNLEKAIEEGVFREDLYYRLNVIPMHLPPLRKMKEDIPMFIDHFITDISKKKMRNPPTLPPETLKCLFNYRWPGNVRELENFMEKLVVLNEGAIVIPEDLPERFHKKQQKKFPLSDFVLSPEGVELPLMVDNMERNMILQALKLSNGVKSKAARLLGLNRTTLIEKMKKKGLNSSEEDVLIN